MACCFVACGVTPDNEPLGVGPDAAGTGVGGTAAAATSVGGSAAGGSPIVAVGSGGLAEGAGGAAPGAGGAGAALDPAGTGGAGEIVPTGDPALIDDFEDGDAIIAAEGARLGQWTAYNDETAGATQVPGAGTAVLPESGGADASLLALHTSGSGFTDWGARVELDFDNAGNGASSRLPYDASMYLGVQFYAKGTGTIRLEVTVPATTEASSGGTCTADCYDTHGTLLTLTPEWSLQTIAFSDMNQDGWGAEAPFTADQLLGLSFKALVPTDGTADFDFWIDELRFVDADSAVVMPGDPLVSKDPSSEAGTCSELGGYDGNGSITYYFFDQGSSEVNCSYAITGTNPDVVAHIATGDGQYFGAMNTADYDNSAMCGACVEITRDGSRSVVVTIVDQCPIDTNPKCTAGHIDISRPAFDQVANQGNEGFVGTGNGGDVGSISWKYVPCPTAENISFKLKEPDNANWNQLLVQGHIYPITSVEINGQPAARTDYNYWEPPDGNMGNSPYEVRVTDANGGVITAYVERGAGDLDSGVQQSCE